MQDMMERWGKSPDYYTAKRSAAMLAANRPTSEIKPSNSGPVRVGELDLLKFLRGLTPLQRILIIGPVVAVALSGAVNGLTTDGDGRHAVYAAGPAISPDQSGTPATGPTLPPETRRNPPVAVLASSGDYSTGPNQEMAAQAVKQQETPRATAIRLEQTPAAPKVLPQVGGQEKVNTEIDQASVSLEEQVNNLRKLRGVPEMDLSRLMDSVQPSAWDGEIRVRSFADQENDQENTPNASIDAIRSTVMQTVRRLGIGKYIGIIDIQRKLVGEAVYSGLAQSHPDRPGDIFISLGIWEGKARDVGLDSANLTIWHELWHILEPTPVNGYIFMTIPKDQLSPFLREKEELLEAYRQAGKLKQVQLNPYLNSAGTANTDSANVAHWESQILADKFAEWVSGVEPSPYTRGGPELEAKFAHFFDSYISLLRRNGVPG